MKPDNTSRGPGRDPKQGPNQGEGDKASARRYNSHVHEFVAEGRVDDAARDAARFVEASPEEALHDEEVARKRAAGGRTRVSVDELVAKSRTVIDRVRPYVDRVVERVRHRLHRR